MLTDHFPGKMSDAVRPWGAYACNLWTRRAEFFSSWTTPNLKSADVIRASLSIPLVFKAVRADPSSAALYVDGGVSINLGMDALDLECDGTPSTRPTIGVRFRGDEGDPVPVRTSATYAAALGALLFRNVITVDTKGDGLDFALSGPEVLRLYEDGFKAADRYLK